MTLTTCPWCGAEIVEGGRFEDPDLPETPVLACAAGCGWEHEL